MKHLRILECAPGLIAYYDGRVPDHRFAEGENWVDDGAISLGIASYALVSKNKALVYDTHVSVEYAAFIRKDLELRGVTEITVLLSHWHLDHVAGTEAFADCEIISTRKTLAHLEQNKAAIADGTFHGPPAIKPLILPTRTFEGEMDFTLGTMKLKFIEANIHSDDAALVWRAEDGLLLAGDTMEDTVTYVGAPQDFEIHLQDLDRLWNLNPSFIFPNHGDPEIIGVGGYGKGLIKAQSQYIRMLMRMRKEEALRTMPLQELIAGPLQMGWVNYFAPYEEVHAQNIKQVLESS
ncbi:MBL fold metallo-hydrolase [Aestuariivirga litoralis]|uniref:MBL fold metallo-hydrolase n=1 Tax=Aestuariivirga litoralis TaxID=2650924 RepID=UPI0018C7DCDC